MLNAKQYILVRKLQNINFKLGIENKNVNVKYFESFMLYYKQAGYIQ